MAELKELFEMVTNKVEPDLDAWREQEERRQRRQRRRRGAAFAVAAVVAAAVVVAAFAVRNTRTTEPLTTPTAPPLSSDSTLIAFDILTGQETQVLDDVGPFRADVSPDGLHIAFLRTVGGHPEIFVANIDGTEAKQVTGLPGQRGCACGSFDPAWAPGGDRIAFSGTDDVGNRGIYLLNLANGRTSLLTNEGGDSFETAPAWTPGSNRMAYSAGSWQTEPPGSGQIFAINLLGGNTHSPGVPLVEKPGATDPSWSLSGRRIVFTAAVPGGTAIFTTDGFGGAHERRHRLTDGTDDSSAVWSPRGDKIAFARGNQVAVLTLSTGEVQILGVGGDPAWSPDGATIYAWRA